MTIHSAHAVASELRRRVPGVPVKKLHKLLYYCQGHHLAAFSEPLFAETIQAWDRGPVVAELWRTEKYGIAPGPDAGFRLDQGALNTVGYVVSRYGAMTGADLESLTHNEPPWRIADERRKLTGDQRMRIEEIQGFFERGSEAERFDDDLSDPIEDYEPPQALIRSWLQGAAARRDDLLGIDDLAALDDLARP